MSDWDDLQEEGLSRLLDRMEAGKATCAVAPTGYGKTRIAENLIRYAERCGMKWIFYTHRRQLFAQTHRHLDEQGIAHGCIASEWRDYRAPGLPGQLAMIQTERVKSKHTQGSLPPADLVIVDEAHCNKSGFARKMIEHYKSTRASVVGLTATTVPGMPYDDLEVLATNSQLRRVGGIVKAVTIGPNEVDVRDVQKIPATGASPVLARKFTVLQVAGKIIEHFFQSNPNGAPSIGFGPSVGACYWLVDRFLEAGIPAAHIDGTGIYLGRRINDKPIIEPSTQQARDEVIDDLITGKITIIWNRFVFREGVNIPEIAHCVLATVFGSESAYVQATGRALRSHPSLSHVTIQDHGGNWWRHGSVNEDRDWSLETGVCARGGRASSLRECPRCRQRSLRSKWYASGQSCPRCGFRPMPKCCPKCRRPVSWESWSRNKGCSYCMFKFVHSHREIIQTDGKLVVLKGNPKKHKVVVAEPQRAWNSLYFPSSKSKSHRASTFNQLKGRFHRDFPRYRIILDHRSNTTYCEDRETSTRIVLAYIPRPASSVWHKEARRVPISELQKPRRST